MRGKGAPSQISQPDSGLHQSLRWRSRGEDLKAARDSVAPGSVSVRSTEQALYICTRQITGVQQNEARAGALLSKKLLCNLTLHRMLFLFSLAMSITVMCGDPSPSTSQHVKHWGGLLFHKIFSVF